MTQQTNDIINVLNSIPFGKVLTYGRVAFLAGNPRGARQVSWVLNSYTKKLNLPWFRVINSKGLISIKDFENYNLQKALLLNEGIIFDDNDRIDITKYMWNGN